MWTNTPFLGCFCNLSCSPETRRIESLKLSIEQFFLSLILCVKIKVNLFSIALYITEWFICVQLAWLVGWSDGYVLWGSSVYRNVPLISFRNFYTTKEWKYHSAVSPNSELSKIYTSAYKSGLKIQTKCIPLLFCRSIRWLICGEKINLK